MKAAITEEGGPFTLFGGEGLMVPLKDLEALWVWGFERYGQNAVQSNGTLITDAHIDLFRRYKVDVGISIDGPGALNDARWAGTLTRTREATARSLAAIERLCQEGMPPSLIVTLHRGNASAEQLPVMCDWFRQLDALGITSARLHILETESEEIRRRYALTTEENLAAFLTFARLEPELTRLRFDVFTDMRRLLRGQDDSVTCVWGSLRPVHHAGCPGHRGKRPALELRPHVQGGHRVRQSAAEGFERYLALYQTPQAVGGCQGCRFFLMCKGECPGTAIDHDWRNRTADCAVWMGLFDHLEAELSAAGETPALRRTRGARRSRPGSSRAGRAARTSRWPACCARWPAPRTPRPTRRTGTGTTRTRGAEPDGASAIRASRLHPAHVDERRRPGHVGAASPADHRGVVPDRVDGRQGRRAGLRGHRRGLRATRRGHGGLAGWRPLNAAARDPGRVRRLREHGCSADAGPAVRLPRRRGARGGPPRVPCRVADGG